MKGLRSRTILKVYPHRRGPAGTPGPGHVTASPPVDSIFCVPDPEHRRSGDNFDRFRCRRLQRAGRADAAGTGRTLSVTAARLLADDGAFIDALGATYGTDLSAFEHIALIQTAQLSRAFVEDPDYREATLQDLGECVLETGGILAIRPTADKVSIQLPSDPLLACYLFGSCGFAQLCDDALEPPVPLFVRPWSPGHGLLVPRHVPREPFSDTLRVQRLSARSMILLQRPDLKPSSRPLLPAARIDDCLGRSPAPPWVSTGRRPARNP